MILLFVNRGKHTGKRKAGINPAFKSTISASFLAEYTLQYKEEDNGHQRTGWQGNDP